MDTPPKPTANGTANSAAASQVLSALQARVARLERRLAERERQLDALLARERPAAASARPTPVAPSAASPQSAYAALIGRLRELVERTVPAGATVMVVSRGDDELLRLGSRRGWHFPQTETGIYAGHHPADSAAAIRHLEELRARGGQFLLLPATASWWLEHYAEFHRHLQHAYALAGRDEQTGWIFDVRTSKTPARSSRGLAPAGQYAGFVGQVQRMVESLLPADAKVAVISRGDPALLKLGRRPARHFPADAAGRYVGHHPADGKEALAHLRAARAAGVQYLVIPATSHWWLEFYGELAGCLQTRARLVQRQAHVATIYEL